jgi:hypothetical protein
LGVRFLNSLEAKFGHLAIPGLIRLVVFFQALVFVLHLINPHFIELLYLNPQLVMHGEVWRLVTYIFIPSLGDWWLMPNYLWLVFALMFLWMLGDGLEQAWGPFKLNLFYFTGMLGTTVAAFFFGQGYSNLMLNLSLLFAFATIYPDFVIQLMLIIPVRIKWIAWFSFGLLALSFATADAGFRMAVLVSLANYALFFWRDFFQKARNTQYVAKRQAEFRAKARPDLEPMHRCEVCKRSDQSNPELEFRVSMDGHEYCTEHLPSKQAVGK